MTTTHLDFATRNLHCGFASVLRAAKRDGPMEVLLRQPWRRPLSNGLVQSFAPLSIRSDSVRSSCLIVDQVTLGIAARRRTLNELMVG